MMDYKRHVDQLEKNSGIVADLAANFSSEQAAFRPAKTRWTVLETVNHLIDIETMDFRYVFELILFHPADSWPKFSIETLRTAGKYNERDLSTSVRNFIRERKKSVAWLRKLGNPDLNALHSGKGFTGEKMRAGDVLVSWVAHDLYHIRQLSLLYWNILNEWGKPFSPKYSGFKQ
ncbi:MAG: DinB family protein [Spirochaetales bacterium]|nr:DinB family protein [Spirochaetales bacterium]